MKLPQRPGQKPKSRVERHLNATLGVSKRATDPRKRDLATIHCLKRDLGLDDDLYRDVLWTVARVRSSKDLDERGRTEVIRHMEARRPPRLAAKRFPGRPNNADTQNRKELLKIEALLTDAGLPWSYAQELLRHMTKGRKEKLEFATVGELAAIIAALHKQALKRVGSALEDVFGGLSWEIELEHYAQLAFDFPSTRVASTDPQVMSQVLRWWKGQLQAVCAWPGLATSPNCCAACRERAIALTRS